MGFFDRPEPVEELEPDEDEFELPVAPWVGGVAPTELVLARSEQAAVLVTSIVAYPDGFDFVLRSFIRPGVKLGRRHLWRHGPHGFDGDEPLPADFLRIGLAWPDGGRATNVEGWRRGIPSPDETAPTHGLEEGGGGGGDREYESRMHAWPLPANGPLKFVVEWPQFGIPETVTELDAAVLQEAAARAHPVWEEDADRPHRIGMHATMQLLRAREQAAPGDDDQ